jgi:hypothetical protein
MTEYATTWIDYKLPSGQEFSVAVCGYSGRIRHMIIGKDPIRRMIVKSVQVEGSYCTSGAHCLDTRCSMNSTGPEHMAHMLDMPQDEPLDEEGSGVWETESTVEALVRFADKMNDSIPEEYKKGAI